MAARKLPDIEFVRECLDYDPDTGIFTWRERPLAHFSSPHGQLITNARDAGKAAGSKHEAGRQGERIYWGIRIAGVFYPAHRLAWLLVYGIDPGQYEIDHIDGDGLNNRITNLRLATRGENSSNSRRRSSVLSGVKGVQANGSGFMARITKDGETHYLGTFRTPEEATEARRKAAAAMHGVFVRHE